MTPAEANQTPSQKAALLEAWGDLIDPREFYFDDFGNPFGPTSALTPFANSRQHGDNEPFFKSEKELAAIRDQARYLAGVNLTGVTILERLTDYVVDVGFETTVAPINGAPKQLAAAALRVLDDFADLNNWHGDLDRELFARAVRDGETFLATYACDGGDTQCRIVEPECVTEPLNPRELEERFGIDEPTCWKFGIATLESDVQHELGYHVVWSPTKPQDFDFFEAGEIEHFRRNTDRNVKRGMSDFYPAIKRLNRSDNLLTNIIESTTAQAAIAWVEENPEGTQKAAVEAGRLARADIVKTQTTPGGNTRTVYGQKMNPGTILRPQPGKRYVPGPGTEFAQEHLAVFQAALRIVGARWGFPEHMVSGDASNNNYASIVEAGTPFNRSVRHKQHFLKVRFVRVLWIVLKNAFDAGKFNQWCKSYDDLRQMIVVNLTAPPLANEDKSKETARNQQLSMAGLLSDDSWAAREQLDLEEERNKGAQRWDAKPTTVIGTTPNGAAPSQLGPASSPATAGKDAPVVGSAPQPVSEAFDESKHKRGQPGNAGQFGPGDASATKKSARKPSDVHDALSRNERNAIEDYSTDKFHKINSALRAGNDKVPGDSNIVKHLDSALARAPKHSGTVFRTFPADQSIVDQLQVGKVFTDKAFISTSKTPPPFTPNGQVSLQIVGKSGVDVSGLSLHGEAEKEVLFPRNTSFKVLKAQRSSHGGWIAILQEISRDIAESVESDESRLPSWIARWWKGY